ncbi:MAG: phosphoribosylformylglycinamidine cyclo-ligase [Flavobacteriales bacterium]|nr:phosphoribosylformylglycinamidine cyclo-ligase [Flavobacteriales bacterium]
MNSKYEKRGVSADKSDVHQAIKNLDKGIFPNAFCKVLPDLVAQDPAYCNVMHADTAGTKTSLAYIYWKETGDNSVWEGIIQDAIVMNIDDMACAGITNDIILSSTIGRNKNLIPGEVLNYLIDGTQAFIQKMAEHGISITLAGGETADVGDIVRTLDVGFTAFARLRRDEIMNIAIQPNDVIIGFASFGKAIYEDNYNGGMGSNGLTSARHDVFSHEYYQKYPESFDPATDESLVYAGNLKLTDIEPETGLSYGKLVLSPTRTYLPLIHRMLQSYRKDIHGIIHCTGGSQTKVMKFVSDVHIIKDNLFPIPPLFRVIMQQSDTMPQELYKVFNMGHRLEVYTSAEIADSIIGLATSLGIDAQIIGYCESASSNRLTLSTELGTFVYH